MLRIADSQDYLLTDQGPFFYLADTVWAAFANLSLRQWRDYLAFRRGQGFNALQISILPITHDTSTSPENIDPFLADAAGNWDFYRLNEAYFEQAEAMLAMAVAAGFVPVLGLVWKCYVPDTVAARRSPIPSAMPLEALRAYVEQAAARFKKFNPIFFVSGDTVWDSDQEPIYYRAALEIVRRVCPEALLTMHMGTGVTLPAEFAERIDFYMYQSGHGPEQKTPYQLAKKHDQYPTKRPIVNGEPCYEGHGKGRTLTRFQAFDIRKATWQSLLSGAKMGITYGGHGVWSAHAEGMGFVQPDWKFVPYPWQEGLRLPGAWDAAYARWLFEQYALFDIEPLDLLLRPDEEVAVSADPARRKIVLYAPHAYDLALKLDLSRYRCQLFDLANRRPMRPQVQSGETSTVRLAAAGNGDVLFLAQLK